MSEEEEERINVSASANRENDFIGIRIHLSRSHPSTNHRFATSTLSPTPPIANYIPRGKAYVSNELTMSTSVASSPMRNMVDIAAFFLSSPSSLRRYMPGTSNRKYNLVSSCAHRTVTDSPRGYGTWGGRADVMCATNDSIVDGQSSAYPSRNRGVVVVSMG